MLCVFRAAELAGRALPELVFGCQAVGRGQGWVLSRAEAQQLALHHPRADGITGWSPKLCVHKPELLELSEISCACISGKLYLPLHNGTWRSWTGLEVWHQPGDPAKEQNWMRNEVCTCSQAICEVFFVRFSLWGFLCEVFFARSSCWPYLWWPQLQLGRAGTPCLASVLLLSPCCQGSLSIWEIAGGKRESQWVR